MRSRCLQEGWRVKTDSFFPRDTAQCKNEEGRNASLTVPWQLSSSSAPALSRSSRRVMLTQSSITLRGRYPAARRVQPCGRWGDTLNVSQPWCSILYARHLMVIKNWQATSGLLLLGVALSDGAGSSAIVLRRCHVAPLSAWGDMMGVKVHLSPLFASPPDWERHA